MSQNIKLCDVFFENNEQWTMNYENKTDLTVSNTFKL